MDLISEIINSAKKVYRVLGAGYEETVYEEAMAVEFRSRNILYDVERSAEIFYKGKKVGLHRLDFVVNSQIVVELKDLSKISSSSRSQIQAYLKTLGLKVAILINFPYPDAPEPEIEIINLDKKDKPLEEKQKTRKK